jgi:hypothetical protein
MAYFISDKEIIFRLFEEERILRAPSAGELYPVTIIKGRVFQREHFETYSPLLSEQMASFVEPKFFWAQHARNDGMFSILKSLTCSPRSRWAGASPPPSKPFVARKRTLTKSRSSLVKSIRRCIPNCCTSSTVCGSVAFRACTEFMHRSHYPSDQGNSSQWNQRASNGR